MNSEGVGVMKDKELMVEETEASHTLGGSIKYTYQSHWFSHRTGYVVCTDAPVCMCEQES